MSSEQSSNAPASLVRRFGRWAGGDRYMVGAPEWQERPASDAPVVAAEPPTVVATTVDGRALLTPAGVPAPIAVASKG